MIDSDSGTFEGAFKRLSGALNRKWTTAQFHEVSRTYFDTLKHASLEDVLAAEVTLRARQRWPKVSDWIAALPVHVAPFSDARVMGTSEIREYLRAMRLHCQDAPCNCPACLAANVTQQPLRFVPDVMDGGEARAFFQARNRLVVTGHWAHGLELARWYAAREVFMASAPRRLARVFVTREPGQEG
jgi:hypothetical protein